MGYSVGLGAIFRFNMRFNNSSFRVQTGRGEGDSVLRHAGSPSPLDISLEYL